MCSQQMGSLLLAQRLFPLSNVRISLTNQVPVNIHKDNLFPQASEREVLWVMRAAIFGVTALALAMALTVESIYMLWYLCADLVYVILFPQLTAVLYLKKSNTYGSLAGYVFGLFFRVAGGDENLKVPAMIKYPGYNEETYGQAFPFKTLSMIVTSVTLISTTYLSIWLFESGILPRRFDIFMCVVNIPDEHMVLASRESLDERTKFGVYGKENGKVNPALKFSNEDLVATGETDDSEDHEGSPPSSGHKGMNSGLVH